jgi:two-component system, chemotaxis family, protein-glutamate methylesterase/glutaminase
MPRTRILVVEDSATVRKRLRSVLAADPEIDLVGEARDGRQAIDLCRALRPDVVTMDMMLPVMSGLAATEYIMAHCPTPILVVSSSFNRGEIFKTYDALAAGAVDVLEKPNGDEAEGDWERRFLSTLKLVARIRVITHPRARLRTYVMHGLPDARPAEQPEPPRQMKVAAVGASTGGPSAIVEVFRALPRDFALPILLVLHLNPKISFAFADWLDAQSDLRAAFARDGEPVAEAAGRILMAPPDRHMAVRDGRIHLHAGPERFSCRPSVDVLFESIAREYGQSTAACLLTGMGRDGASGLLSIRMAGGLTIAQDEATSVIYGMPREAALLGAAIRVLPLGEIGPALATLGTGGGSSKP